MIITDSNPIIREDLNFIASSKLDWAYLENSTILVTGGSGLLGAYLVKSLLHVNDCYSLNLSVICVTRSFKSANIRLLDYLEHPSLNVVIHDVSLELPKDLPSADFVIHAASQASPKYYGSDPVGTLLANTNGTVNLLNYSVRCGASRFMFFSSGEVYGTPYDFNQSISEKDYGYIDPMNVRSCYAESKRIGETMCASWSHQFNMHSCVVRPFHTYGPGMALNDGRVFADFVSDVVHGREIRLKSDGLAMRVFCYISDATLGFLTVLLRGASSEAYNIANPNAEISIRDLAFTLTTLHPEYQLDVIYDKNSDDSSYIKSPVPQCSPNIEKAINLGWTPTLGIKDGFSRTINSYL